jgi:hypothetical protein
LKEGKGLLIIKTLVEGEYAEYAEQKIALQKSINDAIKERKIEAIEAGLTVSYQLFLIDL